MFIFVLKDKLQRDRNRKRSFISLSNCPQGGMGQAKARRLDSIRISHVGDRDPSAWAIFPCFFRYVSGELAWKWVSWDWNQHPSGIPALQTAAYTAAPQHYLGKSFLNAVRIPDPNHLHHLASLVI